MKVLCISSADRGAGKTALALALARRLTGEGLAVGYWKPLSPAGPADPDAAFAREVVHLAEDSTALAPIASPEAGALAAGDLRRRLADSLATVGRGKDVLIVEGGAGLLTGDGPGAAEVLELIETQGGPMTPLHLARYRGGDVLEGVNGARAEPGKAPTSVLINAVPAAHEWFVAERVVPALAPMGIPLLGVLPEDAALATLTVRELAAHLGARVLVNEGEPAMDELFESVMFGSMSAEDARAYFGRKHNKLVVTRGDHPDVHLAALNSSTCCLLLCGGYPSYPFVLDRAEERGVPVLSVGADMKSTIERLDDLIVETRAHSLAKIERFEQLLAGRVDWAALYRALGLATGQE